MTTHTLPIEIPTTHRPAAKYATEAVGTLLLMFTVGACVRTGSPLAPLGIGAVLMALVYAGGHVSGAHYNPAVTVAALVRGRIDVRAAIAYAAAQLVGGLAGAELVRLVVPASAGPVATPNGAPLVAVFIAELVFTFALAYVVLNVATSRDSRDNSFYGLAIGFTVTAGAVAIGGVSGAVFNPAVLIGGAALGLFAGPTLLLYLLLYLLAQLLAGLAAGAAFRALNPADR